MACFSVSNAYLQFHQNYSLASEKVYTNLASGALFVKDGTYRVFAFIGNGICKILSPFIKAATLTAGYIKKYWTTILALGIAWGIIIAGIGAMYGFNATALPFTIGMSIGFGIGLMSGLLTVKILDPKNDLVNEDGWAYNTLWDLMNVGIYQLDPNGTRMILLSVVVTVLLWAASYLPTPVGVFFGLLMGNKFATGAGFLNTPPKYEYHPPEHRLDVLEKTLGISYSRDQVKVPDDPKQTETT